MPGVDPILPHHYGPAMNYRTLADYFFDTGMKLKASGTDEQKLKYTKLTIALVEIRKQMAQVFYLESDNYSLELKLDKALRLLAEKDKEIESLKQQIEFLK